MMAEPEPDVADIESMATCHCAARRTRESVPQQHLRRPRASPRQHQRLLPPVSRTTIHQAISIVVQVGGAVYVIYNNGGGTGLKYGFQSVDNIQTAQYSESTVFRKHST
jgi:hypothetical protein